MKSEFDLDISLILGKVATVTNKATDLEFKGTITDVHLSDPGNTSEGWIVTIDDVENQYRVLVTTNHWSVALEPVGEFKGCLCSRLYYLQTSLFNQSTV